MPLNAVAPCLLLHGEGPWGSSMLQAQQKNFAAKGHPCGGRPACKSTVLVPSSTCLMALSATELDCDTYDRDVVEHMPSSTAALYSSRAPSH